MLSGSGIQRNALVLSILLATLVATTTPAPAQEGAPPAPVKPTVKSGAITERYPPGTLALLRVASVARVRSWLSTSPFGGLTRDAEVGPLWEQLTGMAKMYAAGLEEKTRVNLLSMLDQIQGEATIAITTLKIARPPVPGIMITLDCGDKAEQFKKDVGTLLELVPETLYRRTVREVSGFSIQTFVPVKEEEGRRRGIWRTLGHIHLVWVGSVLVFSNDKAGIDRFVQASGGQEQVLTLGDTDNWKDTIEKLGGKGEMTFFVNIHAFAELLEAATGAMPEDVGPVIAALGLDQFPAMGSATFLRNDALTGRFILRYTGDGKSGLGSLLTFKKADLSIPAWVPDDAWQVMVFNYDFQGAFSGFLGMVKEAGDEPYEEVQEGLERFHDRFGFSLQDDLFGSLGQPLIMVRLTPTGKESTLDPRTSRLLMSPLGGQGPMLIGVRIRDRKTFESFLSVIEEQGAEVTEYLGATIISGPTYSEDQPIVELAVTDTHVLFGLGMTSIVRQVLQRMGGRERGFAGQAGVRDVLDGLPREGIGLLVYNYGKAIATGINAMKTAMAFTKRAEVLAKLKLPSTEVLEKYLGYAASVATYEPGTGLILDTTFRFGPGK